MTADEKKQRQSAALGLYRLGASARAIGETLGISERTARRDVAAARQRLALEMSGSRNAGTVEVMADTDQQLRRLLRDLRQVRDGTANLAPSERRRLIMAEADLVTRLARLHDVDWV